MITRYMVAPQKMCCTSWEENKRSSLEDYSSKRFLISSFKVPMLKGM